MKLWRMGACADFIRPNPSAIYGAVLHQQRDSIE
jgi:hypothetical protein